ncbi:MAG: hypothetical protein R3D71_07410 [Rickettsiales bacterium]
MSEEQKPTVKQQIKALVQENPCTAGSIAFGSVGAAAGSLPGAILGAAGGCGVGVLMAEHAASKRELGELNSPQTPDSSIRSEIIKK